MSSTERRAPAPRLGPRGRLVLGTEILHAYLSIRRLSARRPLPEVVQALREVPPGPGLPLPDPHSDGIRLGRAVVRTLVLVPGGTKCLMRSLVLLRLLARRGVAEGELIIAVQPGPSMLDAHAWIELDGRALLSPGEGRERLLTL